MLAPMPDSSQALPAHVVTIRPELETTISRLLDDAGMACAETAAAVAALVAALADYREEGRSLFPRVLVCDDLPTVLKVLQGSGFLQVGSGPRSVEIAEQALKRCAPLATGGWAIAFARVEGEFRYGVFREPQPLLALDLRSTMLTLQSADPVKALVISQIAPNTVEVLVPGQAPLEVDLSASTRDIHDDRRTVAALAGWLVEDIDDGRTREAALSLWTTLLTNSLREAHGALVAVIRAGEDLPVVLSEDGVVVPDAPRLVELIEQHGNLNSAQTLSDVLAFEPLFAGMLSSDGIVVLNTVGDLVAFNCFVHLDSEERSRLGGARRRAFAALTRLVDDGVLRGAYFRSSDGGSKAYQGEEV